MRGGGLEPPRLSTPDPKSGASTSSAIPACFVFNYLGCPLFLFALACDHGVTEIVPRSRAPNKSVLSCAGHLHRGMPQHLLEPLDLPPPMTHWLANVCRVARYHVILGSPRVSTRWASAASSSIGLTIEGPAAWRRVPHMACDPSAPKSAPGGPAGLAAFLAVEEVSGLDLG